MDLVSYDYSVIFDMLLAPLVAKFLHLLAILAMIFLAFLVYCILKYRINPFRISVEKLRNLKIQFRPFDFIRWLIIDAIDTKKKRGKL